MSTDDRQFRLDPPMGQFPRSGRTANLSDDEAFFPLRKFLIDLTLDSDGDDDDAIEVSYLLNVRTGLMLYGANSSLVTVAQLPSLFTVLVKISRASRRRPHNVYYNSHTWQEAIPLEECPSVVKIIRQASTAGASRRYRQP
jgi:DNA-directed RNA polymerase subunit H (RpoH/RPB5)